MKKDETNTICCPKFSPDKWDDKILEWEHKRFIKDKVFTIFYMPVSFGCIMKRFAKALKNADATMTDELCLSDHTSKWNMDIYLAVDKEISGVENISLSGKFYSKVYEGAFKDTGKWTADFENNVKSKGFNFKKQFMWYTTCPKCAKKYGKNFIVLFAQFE